MTNELRQLLKENSNLLKNENFNTLLAIVKDKNFDIFIELRDLFLAIKVNIPEKVGVIPAKYFAHSNIKNYIVPKNVTEINFGAFQNCLELERVTLHDNIEHIAPTTFKNCTSLKYISIPPKIEVLGFKMFENCRDLEDIQLNAGLKVITNQAFESCNSLKEITIPNSVEQIYAEAFRECTMLKKIKFGSGLKQIEDNICMHCDRLSDVYYNGTIAQWQNIDIDKINYNLFNCTIHCNDGEYNYIGK